MNTEATPGTTTVEEQVRAWKASLLATQQQQGSSRASNITPAAHDADALLRKIRRALLEIGVSCSSAQPKQHAVDAAEKTSPPAHRLASLGVLAAAKPIIDFALWCVKQELLAVKHIFTLIADLLDYETCVGAEDVCKHAVLEQWCDMLSTSFQNTPTSGKYVWLRACNALIDRLSPIRTPILRGRMLLHLANLYPVDERSGLNIYGKFNPLEEVKSCAAAILGTTKKADGVATGTANDQKEKMKTTTVARDKPAEDILLCRAIVSTLRACRDPHALWDSSNEINGAAYEVQGDDASSKSKPDKSEGPWTILKDNLRRIANAFEGAARGSKRGNGRRTGNKEHLKGDTLEKTASKSWSIDSAPSFGLDVVGLCLLKDVEPRTIAMLTNSAGFRLHVASQILVFLDFLARDPKKIPDKVRIHVSPPEADAIDARKLRDRFAKIVVEGELLETRGCSAGHGSRGTANKGGSGAHSNIGSLLHLLENERNWVAWKNLKVPRACPPIVRAAMESPLAMSEPLTAKRPRGTVFPTKTRHFTIPNDAHKMQGGRIVMGNAEFARLWSISGNDAEFMQRESRDVVPSSKKLLTEWEEDWRFREDMAKEDAADGAASDIKSLVMTDADHVAVWRILRRLMEEDSAQFGESRGDGLALLGRSRAVNAAPVSSEVAGEPIDGEDVMPADSDESSEQASADAVESASEVAPADQEPSAEEAMIIGKQISGGDVTEDGVASETGTVTATDAPGSATNDVGDGVKTEGIDSAVTKESMSDRSPVVRGENAVTHDANHVEMAEADTLVSEHTSSVVPLESSPPKVGSQKRVRSEDSVKDASVASDTKRQRLGDDCEMDVALAEPPVEEGL